MLRVITLGLALMKELCVKLTYFYCNLFDSTRTFVISFILYRNFCDWIKDLVPLSRPMRTWSQQNLVPPVFPRFPKKTKHRPFRERVLCRHCAKKEITQVTTYCIEDVTSVWGKRERTTKVTSKVTWLASRKRKTNNLKATEHKAGCLPFTWVNRSIHGLGKWLARFRTGKYHAGIALAICTN